MSLPAFLWPHRARNRTRVEKKSRKVPALALPAINWTRVAPGLLVAAVVGALFASVGYALDRPVHRIEMVGAFQRVSSIDVEHVIRERLRGGFVTANLDTLQTAIESLPWVDHARVQRRWPDALAIQVTEQSAIARWGESGLVNARGELFIRDARHVPPELPRLDGPEGSEHEVSELFFQIQPRLLEAGMAVAALRLDPRGAWEIVLANGIAVRLGRRQLQDRLERFLRVGAPLVASRATDISYLDMRYSNGFSVGWRTAASPAQAAGPDDGSQNQKRDQDV